MAYNLNARYHPLKNGNERVTSDYGYRTDPITGKKSSYHGGIDLISSKYGTDYIVAFEKGVVKTVVSGITWSYANTKSLSGISPSLYGGNYIEIDHGNGFSTRYLHLKHGSISVKEGDTVAKGQTIAYMGTTGYSTGNHLHFEVRLNGERQDPTPYLLGTKKISVASSSVANVSSSAIKGIDVSEWQGEINWSKVKSSGIKFAMIRLGFGSSEGTNCKLDACFHKNVTNAVKAGVDIGCYFYSYALSVEAAKKEAQFVVNVLSKYKGVFTYPIAFDIEDKSQENLGKTTLTNMVISFGEILEKAKYWCSVYCNLNWFNNKLDDSKLIRFDHWVAQWSSSCSYSNKSVLGMWQYSATGRVNGIAGNVDLDIAYKDYPTLIRKNKLNGFTSTPNKTAPTFKVGDRVKIVGERYNPTTSKVPDWVKKDYTHIVTQTEYQGSKVYKGGKECVLLGSKIKNGTTSPTAGINTWVAVDCIQLVSNTTTLKSVDEIAKEVIQGKWGNGSVRVAKLKEAGYDPKIIQDRVDQMLS